MSTECRRVEGLLATSMYESLSGGERARLDEHLDECVICRETLRGFEGLLHEIPVSQPALGTDLLPSIRQQLGNEMPGRRVPVGRRAAAWAAAAAVALVVLGAGFAALNAEQPAGDLPGSVAERPPSKLDRTFAQADRLMDARFYSRAFVMLNGAAERHPDDGRAPEALQAAADLAFDELQWYPEAHTTLRVLRDRYSGQFESTDANRIRLEMLEEAIGANGDYLALRMLDTARTNGDFEAYERVVSQNPGTYIAARAIDEMAAAMAVEGDRIGALETLADSCTHPVAIAQVKLELARTLDRRGGSSDRVRTLYEEAASSGSVALAGAARDALRELDAGR